MKTILCATDFSDAGAGATRVAAALAAKWQDQLLLVHATGSEMEDLISDAGYAAALSGREAQLEKAAASLRRKKGTTLTKMLTGDPDEEIVGMADPDETRLVVLGSLGRRKTPRWKLGSVAERVAASAPVPTLVVRQEEPLLAWAKQKRPLRVLCAYDFTSTADAALAWVGKLCEAGECEVVVVRAYSPQKEMRRLGIPDAAPEAVAEILEREMRRRMGGVTSASEMRIRLAPTTGRPELRLVEVAEEEDCDLIVTGTHQWHGVSLLWHGSTSRGVLHNAPVNVLVVPEGVAEVSAPAVLPRIQRVLVTTDFSEGGNRALARACSVPEPGGIVHALHVIHPGELGGGKYIQGAPSKELRALHASRIKQCEEQLHALIDPLAAAAGVTPEIEVCEHRDPAAAICQAAERTGADVICISTHGVTGLRAALLGSVVQDVLRQCSRPLLLVPAGDK